MFRRYSALWCVPIVFLMTVAYARPDDSKAAQELQAEATRLDNEAVQNQGNQSAVFESLSKQLKIPVSTLQAEQQSTKFGFGQLFIANSLAQATGKSFDQIAQEFNSGKGWGEIAKENNVKLGKVVSGLKRTSNRLENARNQQGQPGGMQRGPAASRQPGPVATPGGGGPRH